MTIDHALLRSLAAFEDRELGIRERFLTPSIGGADTVAVLTTPLGAARETGWVVCSSFAMEQIYLQPFDVRLARGLAARGFAVLRYHAQGYGDSALPAASLTLGSHVRDAVDAVALLRSEVGISDVGLVGTRFGAWVALEAAKRTKARTIALVDPVVRGRSHLSSMVQREHIGELGQRSVSGARSIGTGGGGGAPGTDGVGDLVDLGGALVRRSLIEEIQELDAIAGASGYLGRSLVLQVSAGSVASPDVAALCGALGEAEGRSDLRVATRADAARFGLPPYRRLGDGPKTDIVAPLFDALISIVGDWSVRPRVDPRAAELVR